MSATKVTDPADPQRCQFVTPRGQCLNVSEPQYDFCIGHGGAKHKNAARTYALTRLGAELAAKADDPKLKSLNEEIGILRIMLETTLNRCTDDHELMMQSSTISDLAVKLEKLVTSCDRLDHRRGQVLDKGALLRFAGQVVDIISEELGEDDRVLKIADRITEALGGNE